mmetsp:Transcript_18400/g.24681  ORF Transcript_18400/g.24681 Transcript_18400/m.24681 type:complete len:115 (-) Transcript_18400:967-1311(-)
MVFALDQTWLQLVTCLLTTATMALAAANMTSVRTSTFDRRMDIFNEAKVILLIYHMILFSPFVQDELTQFRIGYSCDVFLLGGLAVNMLMLIVQPIKAYQRKLKTRVHLKKAKI